MTSTNYLAALVLLLTPAISVELLTGNTPLGQYLTPITFIILNITYGGALLLIRETVVRWGKEFTSVIVLAAGYGMLNEAVETKGFFDPHFYAVVGFGLEGFGRWFGINVPWALNISIFHAVFSIIVPFTIVSVIFPDTGRWIGNKTYAVLFVALIAVMVFAFKMFSMPPYYYHYNEGPGPLLLILGLMAIAILTAWKTPTARLKQWAVSLNAAVLFAISVLYSLAFFILPGIVRMTTNSPALYDSFLCVFFIFFPALFIFKFPEPTSRGKVALAAGLLTPMSVAAVSTGRTIPAVIVFALFVVAFVRGARSEPSTAAQ